MRSTFIAIVGLALIAVSVQSAAARAGGTPRAANPGYCKSGKYVMDVSKCGQGKHKKS